MRERRSRMSLRSIRAPCYAGGANAKHGETHATHTDHRARRHERRAGARLRRRQAGERHRRRAVHWPISGCRSCSRRAQTLREFARARAAVARASSRSSTSRSRGTGARAIRGSRRRAARSSVGIAQAVIDAINARQTPDLPDARERTCFAVARELLANKSAERRELRGRREDDGAREHGGAGRVDRQLLDDLHDRQHVRRRAAGRTIRRRCWRSDTLQSRTGSALHASECSPVGIQSRDADRDRISLALAIPSYQRNNDHSPGGPHGPQDRHRRSGRGRRIRRRPHGPGRRGRHLHRSVAGACRAHAQARAARHPRDEGAGVHRAGARAARHRRPAARQGEAGRHRLRVHEVVRHRLGHHADPAVSRARRLRGVAAELHERGDHRRHRRLGQDGRLHRLEHHRQPAGARPGASRRRQASRRRTRCFAPASRTAASPRAPRRCAGWSPTRTAPR